MVFPLFGGSGFIEENGGNTFMQPSQYVGIWNSVAIVI